MQTLEELNEDFAIPGVLAFAVGHGSLLCAQVTTPSCSATLYLQGAHLTHWQPQHQAPVLFLSQRSHFEPGKAIRGGVPVIFPWFGARTGDRTDGPMHGFARTQIWDVAFAAVSADDLHLTLTLGPTDESRTLGYDNFRVAYELVFGRELTMRMSVANLASGPDASLHFEQALHTYLAVGSAKDVRIHGLAGTDYLDKTDDFKRKQQTEDILTFTGTTDRPYLNTEATVTLEDPVLQRRILVSKRGSKTTVIWNPWTEVTATLNDMAPDEWQQMTCIETANAAENAITLRPKEAHTMEAHITIEPISS
jgi:glucose-6-phosphate 1-epimerase